MIRNYNLQYAIFLILISLAMAGCLSPVTSDAQALLNQDYHHMANSELVAYEQRLTDALVRSNRPSSGDVSVGVGFGSRGGSSGYGVGVDKWLGGGGPNASASGLLARRDEVRNEMRRRNLLPQ